MKKTRTKLLSVLIVLCMVLTLLPMAALADDAQFTDMPDNYSTAALQAAVQNGLLKGADGKLRPAANLTRAEMATILNHAFGATKKDGISRYTDVPAGAWYANEMAVAVHMKTLVGSGRRLNPTVPVTRQEALTALASVLNMPAVDNSVLAKYKDNAKVASWARGSVAAMVAAGYATGDGVNLNPTAKITRADFAVIMNSIVKTYITKAGTYTENITGSVMVNVPGVILKNITITGNLIIGDGVGSGDVTLDGVTITGRTIVRGGGVHSIKIINRSNVGTLTISKVDGEVRVAADATSKVEVVVINDGKDDVIVEGNVDKLQVDAGVPVTVQGGTVGEVSVTAAHANVTIASTATVTTLTATGALSILTVQGTVTTLNEDKTATGSNVNVAKGAKVGTLNAAAEGVSVTGEGSVSKANVTGNNVNVATSGTAVTVGKDVTGAKSGDKALNSGTTTTGGTTTTPPTGGGYADTTAPTITAVTLYDVNGKTITSGAADLCTTTTSTVVKRIVVTMSEPVTLSGGGQAMVKFDNAAAVTYGTIAMDKSDHTKLIITPAKDWGIDNAGKMMFTLGSGVTVKDLAGNPLVSSAAITLNAINADAGSLNTACESNSTITVSAGADITITSGTLTIPANKMLIIQSGATLTVGSGATLTNNGTLNIAGKQGSNGGIIENGRINVLGSLVMGVGSAYDNDGVITVSAGGSFTDNRTAITYPSDSTGYIQFITGSKGLVGSTEYIGTTDTDEFEMSDGVEVVFWNVNDGNNGKCSTISICPSYDNKGTVTFNGQPAAEGGTRKACRIGKNSALTVSPNATLKINAGAELDVAGGLRIGGTLENAGTIVVEHNNDNTVGYIDIGGQTQSGATPGAIINESGGIITNNGNTVYMCGSLTNNGTIDDKSIGCFWVYNKDNLKAVAAYAPAGSFIVPKANIDIDENISFKATLALIKDVTLTLKPLSGTNTAGMLTGKLFASGGTLCTPTSISEGNVTYGKMIGPAGSTDAAYATSNAVFDMAADSVAIVSGSVTVGVPQYGTGNMTLTLNNGASFTIPSGTVFDTWGPLTINGTLTVGGTLIFSSGTVTINSSIQQGADGATITVKSGVTVAGTGANGIATNDTGSDVTYSWSGSAWTK